MIKTRIIRDVDETTQQWLIFCVPPCRETASMRKIELITKREAWTPGWIDYDKNGRERWHPLLPGYIFAWGNRARLEPRVVEFARVIPMSRYWLELDELHALRELERMGARPVDIGNRTAYETYRPDKRGVRVAFAIHGVPMAGEFLRWRNGGAYAEVLVEPSRHMNCMMRVDVLATELRRPA